MPSSADAHCFEYEASSRNAEESRSSDWFIARTPGLLVWSSTRLWRGAAAKPPFLLNIAELQLPQGRSFLPARKAPQLRDIAQEGPALLCVSIPATRSEEHTSE